MSQKPSNASKLGRDAQRIIAWAFIPLLLLLPLIAMTHTNEVQWNAADFAFAGFILSMAGIVYSLLTPKRKTAMFRFLCGLTIFIGIVLIWAELAVGIFT